MTNSTMLCGKNALSSSISRLVNVLTLIFAFVISLFFSDEIAHSVKSGLSLAVNVVIPSIFPFIILSDALYSMLRFDSSSMIGRAFEWLFGISRNAVYAFLLGAVCGFPLGVKCTSDLYHEGLISREEAERLIGFCNNTGPAFLISGVGMGLRKNASEGLALYSAMLLSAVLVGIFFRKKASVAIHFQSKRTGFSLTKSIRSAGMNTITVSSYLVFFACAVGLLRNILGESYLYLSILPFIEIGSAASILSKTKLLSSEASLMLSGLAVGFSGLSVHLQALSFISDSDIRTGKYFVMKTIQGILSSLLVLPISILFGNIY